MPRQRLDRMKPRIAIEDVSRTQGPQSAEDTGPPPHGQRSIPHVPGSVGPRPASTSADDGGASRMLGERTTAPLARPPLAPERPPLAPPLGPP